MDPILQDKIYQFFYDPRQGLHSVDKLYKKLKILGINVNYNDLQDFINKQETNQINKFIEKPKEYNSIIGSYPLHSTQMDIMIYDRYEFHKYKYIFCFIDVYSRFAFAFPLTNRRIINIVTILKQLFEEIGAPENINCDNEFNVTEIIKFADENGIKLHFSLPNEINKNAIVERFNRTLAELLQKYRVATKDYDWPKILPDIIYNYNNTYHKTIKAIPQLVFEGKQINNQNYIILENSFKINDKVRVAKLKNKLQKGDIIKFSKTVHKIGKIDGNKIYLLNENDTL